MKILIIKILIFIVSGALAYFSFNKNEKKKVLEMENFVVYEDKSVFWDIVFLYFILDICWMHYQSLLFYSRFLCLRKTLARYK